MHHAETRAGIVLPEKQNKSSVKKIRDEAKEDVRKKPRSRPKSTQRTKRQLKQRAAMQLTNNYSKPRPPLPRRPTWLRISDKSG